MTGQNDGNRSKTRVTGYAKKKSDEKKKGSKGKKAAKPGKRKRRLPDDGFSTLSGASTSCEARCGFCPTCLIAKGNQENEERMNRMGRKYSYGYPDRY